MFNDKGSSHVDLCKNRCSASVVQSQWFCGNFYHSLQAFANLNSHTADASGQGGLNDAVVKVAENFLSVKVRRLILLSTQGNLTLDHEIL